MLVGALANLVLLVAAVVIEFATDWTGIGPWLAAPLLGMVAALVDVARQAATREPEPVVRAPSSAPGTAPTGVDGRPSPAAPAGPVPRRKRRVPVVVAVVVSVLLIGGGGIAIAYGVATATAFITGNQTGTERLAGEVTVEDQGVSTTVHRVEHTQDFTRVELTVVNGLANTITLPVFGNATLSAADGTSLGGDPFRSSWNQTIAPGQTRRGTLVFPGHLDPAGTTATLSFATVFEQGFDGPSSIVVEGSRARARRVTPARGIRSERDAEAPLAGGLDLGDVGAAHDGTGRSLGEPVEHPAHGCLVALDLRLDRAVAAVRHPARDADPLRLESRGVPEAHALDLAVHDHPPADHPSSLRGPPLRSPLLRRYRSRTMTGAGAGSEGARPGAGAT